MNAKFKKTRKSFVGKLNTEELDKLYNNLDYHLNTTLSRDLAVLINYKQRGSNCFDFEEKALNSYAKRGHKISKQMSKSYKIQDFFVFSEDAFYRGFYDKIDFYKKDSGFFKRNIFTLEEVCSAFLLVKSNGEFLKFYGTDYYSEVENFMENELIFEKN
ncbi:hypothetical protein [Winogradskyella sp. A3E31]|uniref:hypothetical protein n=1 Tax=Winogradskyella sp. A3E31 TaxID=3349637 RepID=UPI00398B9207